MENNYLSTGSPQKYAEKYKECHGDDSCEQKIRKDMAKESADNIQALKSCWDAGDTACVTTMRTKIELSDNAYTKLRQQDNMAGRAYEESAKWYGDIIDNCAGKCGWLEASLLKTGADGLGNIVYGSLGAGSVPKGKPGSVSGGGNSGKAVDEGITPGVKPAAPTTKPGSDTEGINKPEAKVTEPAEPKTGTINVSINKGQQNKHIPGTNEYKIASDSGLNKSVITVPPDTLLSKIGTGQQVGKTPIGSPGSKERINYGKTIGNYIDPQTGISTPTTNGIVHYGKNGVHIVPARPSE